MLKPGMGKGVGMPPRRLGGRDWCICPKCGKLYPHPRGTPCINLMCPKCKVYLMPYY